MTFETALAAAVILGGVAVAGAAWRIQAVLTGVLALLGTAGAAVAAAAGAADGGPVIAPLVLSAAAVAIAAGLLSIGYVFNRLLGPEPD